MDFHSLNALHWGCARRQAKQIAFTFVYSDVMDPDFVHICHPDVRASLFAYHGITLGEN